MAAGEARRRAIALLTKGGLADKTANYPANRSGGAPSPNSWPIAPRSLLNNTAGSHNVAIGEFAGTDTQGNYNVYLGSSGSVGDDHVISIGSVQTATFISGIGGATVSGGATVYINGNGQLGTNPSSKRWRIV